MLDVHPPEKMHGIRDFLLHILTITIGLFIALLLEGLVERHHKTELRRDAEQNLRQEIRDNRKSLLAMSPTVQTEQKNLMAILTFIRAREQNQPVPFPLTQFGFASNSLSDASWHTAQATGALGLMDYNQVQDYAAAYLVQDEFTRLQRLTLDDFLLIESRAAGGDDPSKATPAQATEAEPEVRHALAHLIATQDFARGLDHEYAKALGETK